MASRPPTESDPKVAESADDKPSMDKFKDLAKGVFGVSRASYEEEERKFREGRAEAEAVRRRSK